VHLESARSAVSSPSLISSKVGMDKEEKVGEGEGHAVFRKGRKDLATEGCIDDFQHFFWAGVNGRGKMKGEERRREGDRKQQHLIRVVKRRGRYYDLLYFYPLTETGGVGRKKKGKGGWNHHTYRKKMKRDSFLYREKRGKRKRALKLSRSLIPAKKGG